MTSYTSKDRQAAYEALLRQVKGRKISTAVYKAEKAKIDRREEKAVAYREAKREAKALAAQQRRDAKKAAAAAEKAAAAAAERVKKAALKAELASIPKNLLNFKYTATGDPEHDIRELWKKALGLTVRVLVGDLDLAVTVGTGDKGYKEFRGLFIEGGSDSNDWQFTSGNVFIVLKPTTLQASKLQQKFRDGINHCVFTPLLAKLEERLEDASKDTAKRVNERIRKVKKLGVKYVSGVPENAMEEVAKVAGIKISMFDVLGNDLAVYNKNGRQGAINMTNTRENHVDIGMVVDSDPVELDEAGMVARWKEIKEKDEFYMIDGDLRNSLPSKIRTLQGAWRIADPVRDACNQFDKELGINNYKINAMKQPALNWFLKKGRIVNGWSCDIMGGAADGCADMPAAYTQFKKCHMYAGFLGHVHQFRSGAFDRAFVESHLGYYGVKVTGGLTGLMVKLGLAEGMTTVLFSPELLYFMDDGLEVEITQGAWGSRMDFEFPDYMMKNRAYCNWSGRLGIEREETTHTISASSAWASHLAASHKVFYWESEKLLTIKKPVKQCFTAHHILGGITAYTRIAMMEAMKSFQPENLVRVVMDGIYYRGSKPSDLDWFKDKPVKESDSSMGWYAEEIYPEAPPMGKIVRNTLLTGQGGSGKTYSVFTDPGFNNPLFVSPSHILGQDVHKKYGVRYTTIHKLIGVECRPYFEESAVPSVILVDEITQLDAAWIDKVFEMYPQSLILLAGDIDAEGRWYQCRSGSGDKWNTIWKPVNVDVVDFVEDRRSRDSQLKDLKLQIRAAMKACDLECGLFQMQQWAQSLPLSQLDFAKGDTCIAGTHKTNQKLLDMGIVSGYYKKGGFVSDVELPGYEERGSFTIHAYQGKTIESGRVWICVNDLFEYAMLYTAVSRAVSIDQIKFFRI